MTLAAATSAQQQSGSIRGIVTDKDFDAPIAGAQVLVVERDDAKATTGAQGEFVLAGLPPGRYTLVYSKEGYTRQVRVDVLVAPGLLTDADVALSGDFEDMSEFVVQDLQLGAGTEAALLELRFESPSFMDSISSELIGRAGASDAAAALSLVSGATVQDGKFAVIRGLPDRYVSSQLNGIRLPSADEDKRAVELDQFPSAVIESVQVSKTFTPDQQGDASGGAVDIRLKGIPDEEFFFRVSAQLSRNSQVRGRSDFLTYDGGGVDTFGKDDSRKIQYENLGGNWDGAVGVSEGHAPTDYKWSVALGGKRAVSDDLKVGGFASIFYERDSSYHDNGVEDSYWVDTPGGPLVPEISQESKTSLFDVTESSQSVQWGGLLGLGVEGSHHSVALTYLYTRIAEDTTTLAEDTRGKEHFFPGYDPDDPTHPGNDKANLELAPYLRTETLEYTERTTETLQLSGRSRVRADGLRWGDITFNEPIVDWSVASSTAGLDQPDKRQFGSQWLPSSFDPGFPPFIDPFTTPPTHSPFKPEANFLLGNLQRTFKTIDEESRQYAVDLKLPFERWSGDEGYLKFGAFDDEVERRFEQGSFSNFNDSGAFFEGDWDDLWSGSFPFENHPITASLEDVDYRGSQDIKAFYGMLDLPLTTGLNLVGGVRFEDTSLGIELDPEPGAKWYPKGALLPVELGPEDADVSFEQSDALPSIGLVAKPNDSVTLRASYSRTVARQTFKELTPVIQQEFLGGPIFIGNPDLEMSSLRNYDLRADYAPDSDSLFSVSWFRKSIRDPIEYVQRAVTFTFTTAENYPEGELSGYEFEVRQRLGRLDEDLSGLSVGANATFIDAEVRLPDAEIEIFEDLGAPTRTRDMTNAPEHLYNVYVTHDIESTGTQLSLFYTVKGDTLVAGAGVSDDNYVPSIYAEEFGTLNFSLTQELTERTSLQFQAKNLTNPRIDEVYRSEFIDGDVLRSSRTRGREFSISIHGRF